MYIRGTAIIARKKAIARRFGEDRLRAFMERISERLPGFGDNIFVTSRVPIESFLAFQEELVAEFFPGVGDPYFQVGVESAQWVLTEGPYSRMPAREDATVEAFLADVPAAIWAKYYDFGAMTITRDGEVVRVLITGIPVEHPYFFRTIAGFMARSFELFGATGVSIEESPGGEPGSRLFVARFGGWAPRSSKAP